MIRTATSIYKTLIATVLVIVSCLSVYSQTVSDQFDWQNGYTNWEDKTDYSRTYIVDQKHRLAADTNPGTAERPLASINKALEMVQPGEKVLIYSGVYRETVKPILGGKSAKKMIAIEAAPGENVVIKGSKVLDQEWEQKMVYTDAIPDTLLTYTWSRKTWVTTINDDFFENEYYPLQLPNILPDEHKMMPWARLVKDLPPFTSTRALVFQNGKRLVQVESYGDLNKIPGAYWVDADGKTIHLHSLDSGDPNNSLIEIGVKEHLFKPAEVGLNYMRLSGLTFEHCANGFLRTSTGAVTLLGGHHWIIENNTIRHNNSSGLEFGYLPYEYEDPRPENPKRTRENSIGFNIVRNNEIYDCGTAGIRSFVVTDGLISGNHIYDCGWQDAENYWECSGIKMLVCYRTLVKDNHIHDIQGGNGIWLDWDIRYSRVTRNLIHDVQNIQGGIFIEASQFPNLVDNNFVWNIDGNGIYANDTDYLMVYHNLVGNITGNAVHAIVQTDRALNGRKLTAEENLVYNNIFINTLPMRFESNSNKADYNLYVSSREPNFINLEKIQAKGFDLNSQFIRAEVEFNSATKFFRFKSTTDVPLSPIRSEVINDFFGKARSTDNSFPGPFTNLGNTLKTVIE